jgi:hypothetical protein
MSSLNPCRIDGDRWDGVLNHEWHTDHASDSDLEEALLRLDAQVYTMLTIQGDDDTHLTIGGGAGRYVVYATFDNEAFWNLVRPQSAEGIVLLNAGGQEGDFPAGQVVGIEQARAAGCVFLHSRKLDPSQTWQKQ